MISDSFKFYRWTSRMDDIDIIILAKICILMHSSCTIYENVMVIMTDILLMYLWIFLQILSGKLPFLTKGPWALYFGGEDILPELDNSKPGRHYPYLFLISIFLNITILGMSFPLLLCFYELIISFPSHLIHDLGINFFD